MQSNEFKNLEQKFYDEQFIEKCKNLELLKLKFYAFTNDNKLILVKKRAISYIILLSFWQSLVTPLFLSKIIFLQKYLI